ncbi:MAG TPA: PqqD family peptide modification chaperone [Gemmatimonadaceae bacterium]|nr:PqqD family peptide modification chaperone [Gemmatimonadaceae bacterium]
MPNESRPLEMTCLVRHSAKQVHCQIDDAYVLMDVESGEYFELNRVGGRIWREASSEIAIGDLIDRLYRAFEVERATCESQVLSWIEKMRDLGLVEVTYE